MNLSFFPSSIHSNSILSPSPFSWRNFIASCPMSYAFLNLSSSSNLPPKLKFVQFAIGLELVSSRLVVDLSGRKDGQTNFWRSNQTFLVQLEGSRKNIDSIRTVDEFDKPGVDIIKFTIKRDFFIANSKNTP